MHTTFEEKGSHYVHTASKGLCRHFRPSQQRPMRTSIQPAKAYVDISVMMFGRPKLGLSGNGQHKSTNRRLVNMPHERSHGVMRILENFCMQLPKALKIRAIKDIVPRGARCPQHPGFNRHGTIPPPPPPPSVVQSVDLRKFKCLGTFGIPILPCSVGEGWACEPQGCQPQQQFSDLKLIHRLKGAKGSKLCLYPMDRVVV